VSNLLDTVLLPVASEADARSSARALAGQEYGTVTVIHVIEKADGAPDKAGVEQREAVAEEMFEAARAELGDIETDVVYGTDVAEAIFDAAAERGASAIVVTPRGGNRFVRLITGDVALRLVTETEHPVIVLPDRTDETTDTETDE
jgi:nucleotide-binding universal stress UspA family protein